MRLHLQVGLLAVLAWATVDVSRRAVARQGSGRMAETQALMDEQQGSNPIPLLRRAVELSPREAMFHARLGLALEDQGQFEDAGSELILATELSRKYEPRWDLLNFYFRRSMWDRFWTVAADALQMSWGDRSPLFELALQAQGGRTRLERVLPARRDVRFNYLVFLVSRGEITGAVPFLTQLAGSATPEERPSFLYWIDLLLQQRMVTEALQTWRALGESGDPFPWKPVGAAGVTIRPAEKDGWQILLNGSQPEHCVLLESVKPVRAGLAYRLQPEMEEKLSPAGGLLWHLETLEAMPRELEQMFHVPAGVEAVKIRLEYQRPQGSVRAEGEIRLHSLQLGKAE